MDIITTDMTIGEILEIDAERFVPILLETGMHCLGCPASQQETLEEACAVHGNSAAEIAARLNAALG